MKHTLSAVFESRSEADRACSALREAGFGDSRLDAASQGHAKLTVQAPSLEEAERAAAVVEGYGPLDIGERRAGGGKESGGQAAPGRLGSVYIYQSVATADNEEYYRIHWTSYYAGSGGSYEDYAPAYRYGASAADRDAYRGRSWEDSEPGLRGDWERRNPQSAWDKVKEAVRHGWNKLTS